MITHHKPAGKRTLPGSFPTDTKTPYVVVLRNPERNLVNDKRCLKTLAEAKAFIGDTLAAGDEAEVWWLRAKHDGHEYFLWRVYKHG